MTILFVRLEPLTVKLCCTEAVPEHVAKEVNVPVFVMVGVELPILVKTKLSKLKIKPLPAVIVKEVMPWKFEEGVNPEELTVILEPLEGILKVWLPPFDVAIVAIGPEKVSSLILKETKSKVCPPCIEKVTEVSGGEPLLKRTLSDPPKGTSP